MKRELKFTSGKLKRNPKNPILLSLPVTFLLITHSWVRPLDFLNNLLCLCPLLTCCVFIRDQGHWTWSKFLNVRCNHDVQRRSRGP